jgi:uncharacterized protein YwgA
VSTALNIPWKRYALIAELSKRLNVISPQFGKTALQKLLYLLQEVYGVDCGYEFALYSYGPFDSQVLADLDLVEHFGCVSVQPAHSVTGGYTICPTEKVDALRERAADFLDDGKTRDALDSMISTYGRLTAKALELRATVVYVERDMHRHRRAASRAEVCRLVEQLKPKFSRQEIADAIDELSRNGHITLSA